MSDPEKRESDGRRQGRDAYDWIVLSVAVLALLAAGAAAWFTWEQAAVARDQMQRSLRAYVVVTAELKTDREGGWPYVKFIAENMGQTPVYDLVFRVQTAVVRREYEPLPFAHVMRASCGSYRNNDWEAFAATFSKTHTYGLGLSREGANVRTMDAAFSEGRDVYGYGTACYRDIFGAEHGFPFCYHWYREDRGPDRCATRAE